MVRVSELAHSSARGWWGSRWGSAAWRTTMMHLEAASSSAWDVIGAVSHGCNHRQLVVVMPLGVIASISGTHVLQSAQTAEIWAHSGDLCGLVVFTNEHEECFISRGVCVVAGVNCSLTWSLWGDEPSRGRHLSRTDNNNKMDKKRMECPRRSHDSPPSYYSLKPII